MTIGKISNIISQVPKKCTDIIGGISKSKIAKSINEIEETNVPKIAKKIESEIQEKAISAAEALKAQRLADYQYPAGSHFLGCAPDDWKIQEELPYVDLPSVRSKIKAGTLAKSEIYAERRLAKLCDEFGSDKVLAEVNARIEGFPGSLGYGWHRPSAAAESARAIMEAHGWK